MKRLGDLLKEKGLITDELLELALKEQKRTGEMLGEVLLRLGFISEDLLLQVLHEQMGEKKQKIVVDEKAIKLIPKEIAARLSIIPAKVDEHSVTILTAKQYTPLQLAVQLKRFIGNRKVELINIGEHVFEQYFKNHYGEKYNIEQIIEDILSRIDRNINIGEDQSIIKLVDHILYKAIEEGASDIHIEAGENVTRIKFRIDGVLKIRTVLPKKIHNAIIIRLKILANLDISESRIPLDGHLTFVYRKNEVDMRIATSPALYGEVAVIRILHSNNELPSLERLGYNEKELIKLKQIAKQPYGIILASGPTGSGKTTTLYALLNHIFTLQKCIITVEDPPEIRWDLIRQIGLNEKAGLTFGIALRSILRQDPDIIMLGEIRDKITAQTAIKAAETGHLVLSTVHTNTATEAPYRLKNIGVDTFSLGPSLLAVIGQRLVRKICPACKYTYEANDNEKNILGLDHTDIVIIAKGRGCQKCEFSGYKGRVVVGEIFIPDLELQDDIVNLERVSAITLRQKAIQKGMKPMYKDAIEKVLSHITTVEEVERVLITKKRT